MTRNRKKMVEAVVEDGSGLLNLVFFNQPWREKQLAPGTEIALYGKLEVYRGQRQLTNPVVDVLGRAGDPKTGVVVPIYPQSGKADVSTWEIQPVVARVLEWVGPLAETLPADVLAELKLVDRTRAYHDVHQPEDGRAAHQAQRRLRFDEFLRMQVGLVARKRAIEAAESGIAHTVSTASSSRGSSPRCPFLLTGDQRRAIDAITADMASPVPMHRLLQGEVGSGKTLVAITALLMAVQGGYQGALMAPTEVLAEQLHAVANATLADLVVPSEGTLLADRPVTVALLTNRVGVADRRRIAAGLSAGEIDIVVGTHALLYGDAPFTKLGLAVIDEQHRFGVEQRALLRGLGDAPDVLVMTATPIPRTAAMLVYGDLDLSELREMPPGRTPVTTQVIGTSPLDRAEAYDKLRAEVAAGHQAYVVCPVGRGLAQDRGEGRVRGVRGARRGGADRPAPRPAARADEIRGQGSGDARVPGRRDPGARGDDRHRGRGRRPERDRDDRRGCGPVRSVTAPSAPGPGRPGRWRIVVLPVRRPVDARRSRRGWRPWRSPPTGSSWPSGTSRSGVRGRCSVNARPDSVTSSWVDSHGTRSTWSSPARRPSAILDGDPTLAGNRGLAEEVEDLLGDDVEFLFKS